MGTIGGPDLWGEEEKTPLCRRSTSNWGSGRVSRLIGIRYGKVQS